MKKTIAVLTLLLLATAGWAVSYEVIDLGELGGYHSFATAINNPGQIVGYAFTASGQTEGFIWQDAMSPLNSFLGQAFDINDDGTIVGTFFINGTMQASVFKEGKLKGLGVVPGGYSFAKAINQKEGVVGGKAVASRDGFSTHAYLWGKHGQGVDLGTLGGASSWATAINDNGEIVGVANTGGWQDHAFLWSKGKMDDLSTLGGTTSGATHINKKGQIVGYAADNNNKLHACLWDEGQVDSLGDFFGNSWAMAINDESLIVGYFESPSGLRAFSYDIPTKQLVDLTALLAGVSPWQVFAAIDINDNGQIAGLGYLNGRTHAILILPTSD